jgi:hypothetical protein
MQGYGRVRRQRKIFSLILLSVPYVDVYMELNNDIKRERFKYSRVNTEKSSECIRMCGVYVFVVCVDVYLHVWIVKILNCLYTIYFCSSTWTHFSNNC